MTKEQQEFINYLKTNYKNYLMDKIQNCYEKEVDKSFNEVISEIEKLLKK